jgi:phage antirepressor YoqD-like protein
MSNLITINNVRGYIDESGTAHLNLEDVARGLGFTQIATSGNESVRWERVFRYLTDFNFIPTSGDTKLDAIFIPENIFYRLAMKAKNETAEKFQAKVADEILPAIRKTGTYSVALPKTLPDALRAYATEIEAHSQTTALLEAAKPKVIFAESVEASKTSILIGELAKILKQNGVEIGQNRLFDWMRKNGYLINRNGSDYNMPTQYSMELGLFTIKETTVNHSDGHITINKTPKLSGKGQVYFVNKFLNKELTA